jgi:hypothetical protein
MRGSTHPGALESGANDGEALGIGEPELISRPRLYKIAHSTRFLQWSNLVPILCRSKGGTAIGRRNIAASWMLKEHGKKDTGAHRSGTAFSTRRPSFPSLSRSRWQARRTGSVRD